jgi:hypothetical protein
MQSLIDHGFSRFFRKRRYPRLEPIQLVRPVVASTYSNMQTRLEPLSFFFRLYNQKTDFIIFYLLSSSSVLIIQHSNLSYLCTFTPLISFCLRNSDCNSNALCVYIPTFTTKQWPLSQIRYIKTNRCKLMLMFWNSSIDHYCVCGRFYDTICS